MAKTSGKVPHLAFRRAFRGYKRREVEEYVARLEQERASSEAYYQERVSLLVQESEHTAASLRESQEEQQRLVEDNEEYRRQLKESLETIQTLYERLDLLGMETERLQTSLNELKRKVKPHDPSVEQWKERALVAEDTLRRMAEAEIASDAEPEDARSFRMPLGKKAYLDLTLHKKDKNV